MYNFRASIAVVVGLLMILPAYGQSMEMTLLGTGTPRPTEGRYGASTLVKAGDTLILVDAGRGVLQRLTQMGVTYSDLDAIFITHLHSDHIVGLPDLWLTGWNLSHRKAPLKIYGPAGTANMVENLRKAYSFDIKIRVSDDRAAIEGSVLTVQEVEEGDALDIDGVKVLPFDVDHRPVYPALGFRIEYGKRSVALSGDTRYSKNLIKHAMSVDLLIHEVAAASADVMREYKNMDRVLSHHTSPAEAGQIFTLTEPKLAAFSHIGNYGVDEAYFLRETRTTYSGLLVVGEDLMKFVIGDYIEIVRH